MPCTITGSLLGDAELAASEARELAHTRNAQLCTVMGALDAGLALTGAEIMQKLPQELRSWWHAHKLQDEEQRRQEETTAMQHKGVNMEEVP